jgi:transcriptional regulator with XRE-family HTH domain
MSQESLAQQAAIDVRYLGGIERAQRNPSLDVIVRVSLALGVTPVDLLADI